MITNILKIKIDKKCLKIIDHSYDYYIFWGKNYKLQFFVNACKRIFIRICVTQH